MADAAADLFGPDPVADPLAHYFPADPAADIFLAAPPAIGQVWHDCVSGLFAQTNGDLARLQSYLDRHVEDLGLAFRLTGDEEERPWPLNPMPLIIGSEEWSGIESALVQRADLLEAILADIYGPQTLVTDGKLPAAVISGSTHFARRMVGLKPPGGHYLNICAFDLARGPGGEWRVLTDRTRLPIGIGYALENRLAIARSTGGLIGQFGVRWQTEFFNALRRGIAADCERADPRIGLLTPGRLNQSYPEQAHLARHLGFSLVEGRDLVVRDGRLYVRTIAGLKRIDALWRWINARDIDPLNFDSRSEIGVPGLLAACENGLVLANWPGAGVVESRAMPAFLPKLARHLRGEELRIPNAATWWCGGAAERKEVERRLDELVVSSAFHQPVPGLPQGRTRPGASLSPEERAELLAAIERRPMDYTAQEIVRLSTTPALAGGRIEARGFTLRAFLARDASGNWVAMPGGFARISDKGDLRTSLMGLGDKSTDVWIVDANPPSPPQSAVLKAPSIRREQGLLPSQAADNLFWMGRYGERLHQTARVVRTLISQVSGAGAETAAGTAMSRLANLLRSWEAVPAQSTTWFPVDLAGAAIGDAEQSGSVRSLAATVRTIGLRLRDRIPRDVWRVVNRAFPAYGSGDPESMVHACDVLVERYAAFVRLASDGMSRNPAWRFLDMGLCMERANLAIQAAQSLVPGSASAEDLGALLDLVDCQNLYRSRYLSMPTIAPVLDMALLDPAQPRGVAFQLDRIVEHLDALPPLREDGMPEAALLRARTLRSELSAMPAEQLTSAALGALLGKLTQLSDAISRTYFLQRETGAGKSSRVFLA